MRQPSRHRPTALVGLALAAVALTGCGPSVGISPGAAAVVGARSLSMGTIDSTSTLYCEALGPLIKQNSPAGIPLGLVRQQVAANLTERLLGEQLAAEYDVQPASQYAAAVANIRQQFGTASPEALEAGIDVAGGEPYLQTVQLAIGRKLLQEGGESAPSDKAAFARGQVATQDWLRDREIDVDPSLGVTFDKATPVFARDQTSYPLSPLASQGNADPSSGPDPAYTGALPPSQVCR